MSFGKRQSGLAPSNRAMGGTGVSANAGSPAPAYGGASPSGYAGYETQHVATHSTGYDGSSDDLRVDVGRTRPAVWMRYISAIIDFTLLLLLTIVIMFGFNMMSGQTPRIQQSGLLAIVLVLLWVGYGVVLESSGWQGTVGKKVTGLIVTDNYGEPLGFGAAILRGLGKILSSIVPLYIPYIMAHHTKHKQTLHDMMAGSRVYRRSDAGKNAGYYFE